MVTTFFSLPATLAWLLLLFTPTALSVKIYLCGDSTMAKTPNNLIYGWGEPFRTLVTTTVINKAQGGRSARSFAVEGRFQEVAGLVTTNDIVIMEFGHNDGGSLKKGDNGRTDCPGSGSETCQSVYQRHEVTVKTFSAYLIAAGNEFAAKGAKVVFSSMTPNNIWESKDGTYTPGRFVNYAMECAKAVPGATFVDHGLYTAKAYKALGAQKVNALYPVDHTHTNDEGAHIVASAFARAVLCARNPTLLPYMKTEGTNATC